MTEYDLKGLTAEEAFKMLHGFEAVDDPQLNAALQWALLALEDHGARRRVESAAIAWWNARKPAGWTDNDHLQDSTTNCETDLERRLARAVGLLIECSRIIVPRKTGEPELADLSEQTPKAKRVRARKKDAAATVNKVDL